MRALGQAVESGGGAVPGRVRCFLSALSLGAQSGSHAVRFHSPARRTGRADFPHPALSPDHAFAHGRSLVVCPRRTKAAAVPQPFVGEAHVSSRPHLVLPPEPLSQPPGRVLVYRLVGRADLPEGEVVCPAGHHPVEALYDPLCGPAHIPPVRVRADPAADALNARLARPGPDVPAPVRWAIVPADAVPKELERLLGASEASGLLRVDR